MDKIKVTDFIRNARQQGIADPEILTYLKGKGVDLATGEGIDSRTSYEKAMGIGDNTRGIIPQAVDKFKEGFEQTKEGANDPSIISGAQKIGRGLLNEAGAALRVAFSPVEIATKIVSQVPGIHQAVGSVEHGVNLVADKIGNNKKLQEFMMRNPNADEVLGNLITIGLAVGAGKIGAPNGVPATEAGRVVDSAITHILEKGDAVMGSAAELAAKAKEKVMSVADTTSTKVDNAIKGKPEAEILATPKDQVHTLSAPERKLWFDNEQARVTAESDLATQKIKSDLKVKADAASVEAENLQTELATTSRDKVLELRPKIVKAMGEQSKIYRSLIDAEMAGKENIPIQVEELKTYIDTQFGENPGQAAAVKERLGLMEQPAKPLKKGQVPTIEAGAETKTLGDLYKQTKDLKQDISAGAKSGTKTFSPSDKLTDDAIHTLTDFMKKSGVDFREANQFWSRYAPIRNQLAVEAKPFLQTGTQTKTFANTLKRVSEGKDINNENFIDEVENLVGEPITKEAKGIVAKLDAVEKAKIADKLEAENKILETAMKKDKTLSKLSSEQFEIERQARVRSLVKKVVIGALGLLGAKKLGITKFFGL